MSKRKAACAKESKGKKICTGGPDYWKSQLVTIQSKIKAQQESLDVLTGVDKEQRAVHEIQITALVKKFQMECEARRKPILQLTNELGASYEEREKYELLLKNPLKSNLWKVISDLNVILLIEDYCTEMICSTCKRYVPRAFTLCMTQVTPKRGHVYHTKANLKGIHPNMNAADCLKWESDEDQWVWKEACEILSTKAGGHDKLQIKLNYLGNGDTPLCNYDNLKLALQATCLILFGSRKPALFRGVGKEEELVSIKNKWMIARTQKQQATKKQRKEERLRKQKEEEQATSTDTED